MKFQPKCRTKKLRMIYIILGSFCPFFLIGKGPIFRPRKILAYGHVGRVEILRIFLPCKWLKLASLVKKIYILHFQFFNALDNLLKNILYIIYTILQK